MSSSTPGRDTWPTLDRVREVVEALSAADDALEDLGLAHYNVINHDDPMEPNGAPLPTTADVAAMTVLVEHAKDELRSIQNQVDEFAEMRNAATYLTMLRSDA